MDSLNSIESRKLTPAENMARLEKAINIADQRIRMRREIAGRVSLFWGTLVALPMCSYMLYHLFAPHGVMQNHKTSSGAYIYWAQNFLYRFKPHTQVYRPEMYFKESSSSLHMYSKKVQQKREAGELPEGQHHPEAWH